MGQPRHDDADKPAVLCPERAGNFVRSVVKLFIALSTRARASSLIYPRLLRTRDTVETLRPASLATSLSVAIILL